MMRIIAATITALTAVACVTESDPATDATAYTLKVDFPGAMRAMQAGYSVEWPGIMSAERVRIESTTKFPEVFIALDGDTWRLWDPEQADIAARTWNISETQP